jgi:hypothetical protein
MKMLIRSNKGNNSIPPLQNTLNDKHFDDIVYDDPDKCELLNKYFTLISKLSEENKDLPEIENRTDNIISDIQIREKTYCILLIQKKLLVLTVSVIKC